MPQLAVEQGRQWAGSCLRILGLRWLGLQWSCWESALYDVSGGHQGLLLGPKCWLKCRGLSTGLMLWNGVSPAAAGQANS